MIHVQFLQRLRRHGPWNLMALHPETKEVQCATFVDAARAVTWIGARNGEMNIYLAGLNPAATPTGWKGRAVKGDIVVVVGRHIDIDLDKFDADHPWYALSLDERKARKVEELRALVDPGRPSVIVDTGGGLQAYWLLDEPEPVTPDLLSERANEHLIAALGGDPGTFEINRPLRLPGTMNLPDAKKRERGRVPALAKVIEFNDRRYATWDFELAPPRAKDDTIDIDIGDPDPVEDLEALFEQHRVPSRIQRIVREGPLSDLPKAFDNSRSAWVLDAACGLVRAGVPDAQIVAILLDEELGIGRDDNRQAYRAVKKANRLVAQERIDFDAEVAAQREAPIIDNSDRRARAPVRGIRE